MTGKLSGKTTFLQELAELFQTPETGNQNADVFNTHTRAQKKAALSVTRESYGFAQETAETATTSELENLGDRRE